MNRHGISLNPTQEESALLRKLWRADDAEHYANKARWDAKLLREENDRLRAEIAVLKDRLGDKL